jgi:hypothetical protein
VRRVPTWSEHDYGVELVDQGTQISQFTTEASSCMDFSAVADVEPDAQVFVSVDFNLDGRPDFHAPIGETAWHPVKTRIFAPIGQGDHAASVSIRKEGSGHAALAEMRLQIALGCTGDAGTLAGPIGALCAVDADCESGVCCLLVCSQCCDQHAPPPPVTCPGGSCAMRNDLPALLAGENYVASQCSPHQHAAAAGGPCFTDDDCKSGACVGAQIEPRNGCAQGDADLAKCGSLLRFSTAGSCK